MLVAGNWRKRDLKAKADGRALVQERGSFVEVLDGGIFGAANLLYFVHTNPADDFDAASSLACVPGACAIGDFDSLLLVTPSTSVQDTVRVRIGTGERAVEKSITGKPRVRWLDRTGDAQIVAPGTGHDILDLTSWGDQGFDDREDFSAAIYWHGWVFSDQPFQLFATAVANPSDPHSGEVLVQVFDPSDYSTLPFPVSVAPAANGYISEFTHAESAGAFPSPFPANLRRLIAWNSGSGPAFFNWCVGYRGG